MVRGVPQDDAEPATQKLSSGDTRQSEASDAKPVLESEASDAKLPVLESEASDAKPAPIPASAPRSDEQPTAKRSLLESLYRHWLTVAICAAATLAVFFLVDLPQMVSNVRSWWGIQSISSQPTSPFRPDVYAAARLPSPSLFPATFELHTGDTEIRALDVFCETIEVKTTMTTQINNGGTPNGPRVAGMSPHSTYPATCQFGAALDRRDAVIRAVVAIDAEFSVSGRTGRYYVRSEFTFDRDRSLRPLWVLAASDSGPVEKRRSQFGNRKMQ